jgi:hypothetical protein
MADALMRSLPGRRSRPRALAVLSTLVGAVVLARASSNEALAAEILQAAQAALCPRNAPGRVFAKKFPKTA